MQRKAPLSLSEIFARRLADVQASRAGDLSGADTGAGIFARRRAETNAVRREKQPAPAGRANPEAIFSARKQAVEALAASMVAGTHRAGVSA